MTSSFNSFEKILHDTPSIDTYIKDIDNYWAHTNWEGKLEPESLVEHIYNVNHTASILVSAHQLDSVIDSLISEMISGEYLKNPHDVGEYIKVLFVRTIVFHDYGKLNPNFQWSRMNNPKFNEDKSILIGSQHSKLSAFLFIHIHLKEIHAQFKSPEEQSFLWAMLFLFSNPILKHHAPYIEHDINFEKDIFNSLNFSLSFFDAVFSNSWQFFERLEKDGNGKGLLDFYDKYVSSEDSFPLYALLKCNFSLLTTADYYATGNYMQGIKVEDFGLLNDDLKERFFQSFKAIKPYNKDLFKNTSELSEVSFEDVSTISNKNLNKLRQKLAREALLALRKSSDKKLFYLEAPTGSGKTNVSLALTMELLNTNIELNKVFYVFPFTTLVTQTFKTIKESLNIGDEHIIQLHSKSGFHQPDEEKNDGNYGDANLNFINNYFINYPIILLTHIKFFDVLKGNGKESNYIHHRLANSVVIIDELQSYDPRHWDKIIFLLSKYALFFNMKIILMSATLPKIARLLKNKSLERETVNLIHSESKPKYFQNPNFSERVTFDFSLLEERKWKRPSNREQKEDFLLKLKDKLFMESELYAKTNTITPNSVKTLIEFITKKSASHFLRLLSHDKRFESYTCFLISGEILDPRRKHIINELDKEDNEKVILVTTQVVEAGVDIDMDLGFKDRALIDSDEQLAGRINRNARKSDSKVFLFDFDRESFIYKNDKRLSVDIMKQPDSYKNILITKDFDSSFYNRVNDQIIKINQSDSFINLDDYLKYFSDFKFRKINTEFKLIDSDSDSVFIPLNIPLSDIGDELSLIQSFKIPEIIDNGESYISGKDVWLKFEEIIKSGKKEDTDYYNNQIDLKRIYGLLSKFMISMFNNQIEKIKEYLDYNEDDSNHKKYGIYYMSNWQDIYSYEGGIDTEKVQESHVFI